ncbi:O-acetyltransferase OatA [Arthrobacter sp. Bi26]|uniref:acyltransferase family protein n=1 Tax=Arthrobacter sp. Bi26 TaxID=2822350 RepID=UPI001DEED160|nr:acyltransferase [Arthrobacter sp. Bi26]CAH0231748.1 O-acetyltransferase OatA [Arthrobacter sp. Bi26]
MTVAPVTTASPTTTGRLYALDAIRGFAVLLVLLRHAWSDVFGGAGIVGVVMFFALSGYLITGVLERDIVRHGKVLYGRFYAHRAIRLVPALVFMLAGFCLIEGLWDLTGARSELVRTVLVSLTYTSNVPGLDHGSDTLGHLWTLATEEQFYLVWPIIIAVAIRYRSAKAALVASAVVVTALCAATIAIAGDQIDRVYNLPTSWCVAMVIGAAAWFGRRQLVSHRDIHMRAWRILQVLAPAGLVAVSLMPEMKSWPATYLLIGPLVALGTVVLIISFGDTRGVGPALARPLVRLGGISYAAYLWNYPISHWMGTPPLPFLGGLASIVLTILAASASWLLVEKPMQRVRGLFDARSSRVS